MIYDHAMKVNGKYYAAGENVPEVPDRGSQGKKKVSAQKDDAKLPSPKQEKAGAAVDEMNH